MASQPTSPATIRSFLTEEYPGASAILLADTSPTSAASTTSSSFSSSTSSPFDHRAFSGRSADLLARLRAERVAVAGRLATLGTEAPAQAEVAVARLVGDLKALEMTEIRSRDLADEARTQLESVEPVVKKLSKLAWGVLNLQKKKTYTELVLRTEGVLAAAEAASSDAPLSGAAVAALREVVALREQGGGIGGGGGRGSSSALAMGSRLRANVDARLVAVVGAMWAAATVSFKAATKAIGWPRVNGAELCAADSGKMGRLGDIAQHVCALEVALRPLVWMEACGVPNAQSRRGEGGTSSTSSTSSSSSSSNMHSGGIRGVLSGLQDAAGAAPWALQLLVRPILRRFQFHFEGRRATNRIDKPEWAFTHLIESIRDHSTFLVEVLQPWINDVEGTTYVDMQAAFAQVLVAAARHRIENLVLPVLMPAAAATGGGAGADVGAGEGENEKKEPSPSPSFGAEETASLLCHTVDEMLSFEAAVCQQVGYSYLEKDGGLPEDASWVGFNIGYGEYSSYIYHPVVCVVCVCVYGGRLMEDACWVHRERRRREKKKTTTTTKRLARRGEGRRTREGTAKERSGGRRENPLEKKGRRGEREAFNPAVHL